MRSNLNMLYNAALDVENTENAESTTRQHWSNLFSLTENPIPVAQKLNSSSNEPFLAAKVYNWAKDKFKSTSTQKYLLKQIESLRKSVEKRVEQKLSYDQSKTDEAKRKLDSARGKTSRCQENVIKELIRLESEHKIEPIQEQFILDLFNKIRHKAPKAPRTSKRKEPVIEKPKFG